MRTDPELARERSRGSGRVRTTVREGGSGFVDAFDGKTHPELFLPHQVFRTLMDHAFLGPERSGLRFRGGRARSDAQEALDLKQIESCRSRAEALSAARREFGSKRFDRFLYEVIAVNMFHVAEELPRAEDLRRAEGGCQ